MRFQASLLLPLSFVAAFVLAQAEEWGLHARAALAEAEANAGLDFEEGGLYARDAEAEVGDMLDIIPRSWLEGRSGAGAIHLGDDGILRNLKIRTPALARRDEHLLAARWEVVDAIPLSPVHIKRFIDDEPLLHDRRHLEDVFEGIDGRDVHPRDWMNPHPKFLPRSLGSIADVRDASLARRDLDFEGQLLGKRTECSSDDDCLLGTCVKKDMMVKGTCSGGFQRNQKKPGKA